MATKTSSKTATRKPADAGGRRRTSPQNKTSSPQKGKLPKKKIESTVAPGEAVARVKQPPIQPEKPEPELSKQPSAHAESVSLIDRKRPAKKSQVGEIRTKRAVLPPISRIRASIEATSKPAPAAPVSASEPTRTEPAEQPLVEGSVPAEVEAGPQQKILLIKPPIVVKQFAAELGLKPHQLIAELMTHNIFANINQTVEPDIAAKIAENHGFILEKERRGKRAEVRKEEKNGGRAPPPVLV